MNSQKKKVVLDWMRKIHILEHAHRLESIKWKKWNNKLGVPSLIVATLIGVLGGLCEFNDSTFINVFIASGAIIVAILSGLQTFLKPSEIAEKHLNTSNTFEQLRHNIEYALEFINESDGFDEEIENIKKQWERVDQINVSQDNFDTAKGWIKDMNKYPEELSFLEDVK